MNKDFCCKRMKLATEDIACPLGYSPEARYLECLHLSLFLKK